MFSEFVSPTQLCHGSRCRSFLKWGSSSPSQQQQRRCTSSSFASSCSGSISSNRSPLCSQSAIVSCCFGLASAILWHGRRRQRSGPSRVVCQAVAEVGDSDSDAVLRWVDTWANPVEAQGGIRVVTSLSTSEEGVVDDLISEALLLSNPEQVQTTLLVCPHVAEWTNFEEFNDFFGDYLENGMGLAEDFDMEVVPFHPDFRHVPLHGNGLEEGDELDFDDLKGTVLDADAGEDENGEPLFRLGLDGGGERLVPYEEVIRLMEEDDEFEDEGDVEAEGMEAKDSEFAQGGSNQVFDGDGVPSKAKDCSGPMSQQPPRPVLQLLRLKNLD
eukprot:TRINITY_DN12924_c1_g1_i5.p1 TRINITY_DN12924_c1_g1~~TRINITY_DN12924_c1_g1_i5.p1  ORF type:complete len:328 (+),score=77.87 TRINITY_DN12924_c1_g1_i5:48-1031(+)